MIPSIKAERVEVLGRVLTIDWPDDYHIQAAFSDAELLLAPYPKAFVISRVFLALDNDAQRAATIDFDAVVTALGEVPE